MSDKCLDCTNNYGDTLFLWVDDKTWKKIGCKKSDYLCAYCLIKRIEKFKNYMFMVPGEGDHSIAVANAKIVMTQKHHRVVARPCGMRRS